MREYRNIVVSQETTFHGTKDICMNIFIPDSATLPARPLVYCHGGAFLSGDYTQKENKSNAWYTVRDTFEELDVALVCVGYRLASEAVFPAQIHDLKGCIRYLRAHGAEYGLNTERIGVAGESAGGHLSVLLALTEGVEELEGTVGGNLEQSSAVQFCADFYGLSDLLLVDEQFDSRIVRREGWEDHCSAKSPEGMLLGLGQYDLQVSQILKARRTGSTDARVLEKLALAESANPVKYALPGKPPVFIGHGDADSLVPVQQNVELYGALCRAGCDVTFVLTHDQDHGDRFHPHMRDEYIRWMKKQCQKESRE